MLDQLRRKWNGIDDSDAKLLIKEHLEMTVRNVENVSSTGGKMEAAAHDTAERDKRSMACCTVKTQVSKFKQVNMRTSSAYIAN